MDFVRRQRSAHIQDQENINVLKGKTSALPVKRFGLTGGALGEINSNVQIQRDATYGKVKAAAEDIEKKSLCRGGAVRSYGHVQSKVDTGRTAKPVPTAKLRREESTAGHALRALAQAKNVLKEVQNTKSSEVVSRNELPKKKIMKVKSVKQTTTAEPKTVRAIKPLIKEQTENLDKLTLKDSCESYDPAHPDLPDDIEDIDAADNNSPLLMSTYIKDIYHYLLELEEKYPIENDHLKNQAVVTAKTRATLVDWLVEVHRQFSLVLETFHLTVGIIDRYLQVAPTVELNRLQLVGVTAMFIASKYEEIYPPDIKDFAYITDNAYNQKQIFQCERDILSRLGFCLARPIPLSFLRRYIKAANGSAKNHHLAKYFVDLSLVEYTTSHYRPSELAAAALCLSLYLLSNDPTATLDSIWSPTLVFYSRYSLDHIQPIIKKIANNVINVEKSKFKAVQKRYSDASLAKVANLPQLKGEALMELARMPVE